MERENGKKSQALHSFQKWWRNDQKKREETGKIQQRCLLQFVFGCAKMKKTTKNGEIDIRCTENAGMQEGEKKRAE